MHTLDHTIGVLDSLLRGELSAVETYSQAIHKTPGAADASALEKARACHLESVHTLRRVMTEFGGDPPTDSGIWGDFAKVVEGVATFLGTSPAIAALAQGEKHGISEYEDALEDKQVHPEVKDVIVKELLPGLRANLAGLDLMNSRHPS